MAVSPQMPGPVPPAPSTFTMRGLWRLALWGSSAALALALVVLIQNTDTGQQRIAALRGIDQPTRIAAAPATIIRPNPETEMELRRQADGLRSLAAERDRVLARLETLERNLEDVTGSVRQVARTGVETPTVPSWLTPPMVIGAPPTTEARTGPRLQQAEMPPADTVAVKREFGLDLGPANNIEGLRTLWNAAKLAFPELLEPLRPVVAMRDDKGRTEPRLIVGPVANSAMAAKLCASVAAAGRRCQPAVFDGQRLQ